MDVVAVGEKGVGQVTADKARAAGDEVLHEGDDLSDYSV
jgi:hypothetical protein